MSKKGFILSHIELDGRMVERLKESGLDLIGIHPGGGETAAQVLDELLDYLKNPEFTAKLAELEANGMEIEYELHALNWLLPKSVLDEHEDWKRVDGDGNRTHKYNFCVSADGVLDYVTDRCYYLATQLGQKSHRYNIWMDDIKDGYCHCEKCKKLTAADQTMIFCLAVLRGLRRYDPEATQSYLAYFDTLEAPKSIPPQDGIFLEFAPIERWTQGATHEFDAVPGLIEYFGSDTAKVLEYWVDNSLFSKWKKPPVKCVLDKEGMKRDLKFYRAAGFKDMTSFGLYLGAEHTDLHGEFSIKEYADCFDEE